MSSGYAKATKKDLLESFRFEDKNIYECKV